MNAQMIEALCRSDEVLGKFIKKVGSIEIKPKKKQSPFESLVEAIVYQQLTMKAAATILGRVKALYPDKPFPTPDDILATPDDQLGSIGLFRAKIAALKPASVLFRHSFDDKAFPGKDRLKCLFNSGALRKHRLTLNSVDVIQIKCLCT